MEYSAVADEELFQSRRIQLISVVGISAVTNMFHVPTGRRVQSGYWELDVRSVTNIKKCLEWPHV